MAPLGIWISAIVCTFLATVRGQPCTEGQEIRRNNMYYKCRSGFQVPVACSTVDGVRVEPGATYRTSTFLFTCQQPHSQAYTLVPNACIRNGQVVNIGSTVAEENFWYSCTREGEQVVMKIAGCVGDNGARVGPNGIVTKSSFLFRCSFNANNVVLEAYGCVLEGAHYQAGREIVLDHFWYQCNIISGGGGLELKLSGCVDNGQKLFNGSTVVRTNFVFRCDILANQARLAAVGCLDEHGGHHMIGETWREMSGVGGYVMECKREQTKITKQSRQCYYQGADGQGAIDPNCVRRFGTTLVKCIQRGQGGLVPEITQNANDESFRNAINAGFRQC